MDIQTQQERPVFDGKAQLVESNMDMAADYVMHRFCGDGEVTFGPSRDEAESVVRCVLGILTGKFSFVDERVIDKSRG